MNSKRKYRILCAYPADGGSFLPAAEKFRLPADEDITVSLFYRRHYQN
ncbi:hypothetical protein [Morganella morganii IS15]|nr:hypothetical protein CSB69_1796 [Morganella morganii]EMP53626.1 hypothetical protein C790_00142 [Morganella morganii SC01]CDK67480.1 hypothetical protein [Morganella morganii IS15]